MLLTLAVLALLAPQASPVPSPGAAPARRPPRAEASPRPAASDEPSAGETTAGEKAKDREAAREKEEPPVVTRHEARVGGRTLRYTVTTGMMPLKSEAGETEASIFYMAYVAERTGGPEKRPLTFSFNGGPGSSSVWLHLGAIGPKRVRMLDEGAMPAPPFELVDNDATWLDLTDLVFIDPVGTGYSRPRSRSWARSSGVSRATSSPSASSSVST